MGKFGDFVKKTVKRTLISLTIVAGVVGVLYYTVEPVKDFIDDTINKIGEVIENEPGDVITEKLAPVQNIQYNQETEELTFDAVEGATTYLVEYSVKETGYTYRYTTNETKSTAQLTSLILPGQTVVFSVTAYGNSFLPSDPATFEIVVEKTRQEQNPYEQFSRIYSSVGEVLNSKARQTVTLQTIDVFDYENQILTLHGVALNRSGVPFEYKLVYDLQGTTAPAQINDINTLGEVVKLMSASAYTGSNIDFYYNAMPEHVDVTEKVATSSDILKDYIEQGYSVEIIKYNYSDEFNAGQDKVGITVSGFYKLTHETLGTIIVEASHNLVFDQVEGHTKADYINSFATQGNAEVMGVSLREVNKDAYNQFSQVPNSATVSQIQNGGLEM
ncbi:hypothetical protein [Acholeplasma equifetale]|uniref:hypothetical protein n=1 Tax=Acholeplasma equifetale TaxID=264634 RepID=UPI00047CA36E|nr:hypothetical protein [Acholeplasma equifetale]